MGNLFEVEHLTKIFNQKSSSGSAVHAVNDISFEIREGETFGLVGESGCGKSTTCRMLVRLLEPTSGVIRYRGRDIVPLPAQEMRALRRDMQMIFQDPYSSLNPRMTCMDIIAEPMIIYCKKMTRAEREEKVYQLLETVGLPAGYALRYPHEFSGGQRQRIGIARALALNPSFIVCDEPVSALDVSIQSQVLNLINELKARFSLTYLFIAHGLNVVKYISDRIGVMYLGHIIELAESEELYWHPLHPYSQSLISAIPEVDIDCPKERILLRGEVPSPTNMPSGCPFHTRCWRATKRCREEKPILQEIAFGHMVACHRVL